MICKQEAIVLRSFDYSDSSRIITLFTKDYGKIGIIARGIKRRKNPFLGTLEICNLLSVIYFIKPTRQLGTFQECRIINHFPRLRSSLEPLFVALYCTEMIRECVAEADPNIQLFKLLRYSLGQLSKKISPRNVLLYFQWYALELLGHSPCLFECLCCRVRLDSETKESYFSAKHGGCYCYRCSSLIQHTLHPIPSSLLRKMLMLFALDHSPWKEVSLSQKQYLQICSIFRYHIQHAFRKEFRLTRYVVQI